MKIILIGNGFDIENNINIRFEDFVKWIKEFRLKEFEIYFSDEYWNEFLIKNNTVDKWSDLEGYLAFLVNSKNKNILMTNKINALFEEWLETIIFKETKMMVKSRYLDKIFNENEYHAAISLNYTKTLISFGMQPAFLNKDTNQSFNLNKLKNKFLNIHSKTESPKYVIGNDCTVSTSKTSILKNGGYQAKFKNSLFKQIISNNFSLDIYGFSFGNSDAVLIEGIQDVIYNKKTVRIFIYSENFSEDISFIKSAYFKNLNLENVIFVDVKKEKSTQL